MNFLLEIPSFSGMKKNSIFKFIHLIQKVKFKWNQTVYAEGDEINHVYIVWKGDFELARKLKKSEPTSGAIQNMLDIKPRVNILASKLTEIVDIPNS